MKHKKGMSLSLNFFPDSFTRVIKSWLPGCCGSVPTGEDPLPHRYSSLFTKVATGQTGPFSSILLMLAAVEYHYTVVILWFDRCASRDFNAKVKRTDLINGTRRVLSAAPNSASGHRRHEACLACARSLPFICGSGAYHSSADPPQTALCRTCQSAFAQLDGTEPCPGQALLGRHCSSPRVPGCLLPFSVSRYVMFCLPNTIDVAMRLLQKYGPTVVPAVPSGTRPFSKIELIVIESSSVHIRHRCRAASTA